MAASTLCVELTIVTIFFFSGNPTTLSLKMWTYSSTLHVCINGFNGDWRSTEYIIMNDGIETRNNLAPFYEKVDIMPDVPEGKILINSFMVETCQGETYIGKEMFLDEIKLTYYFYPTVEHEAIMFLYLENQATFEELEEGINSYTFDAVHETYLLLIEALYNGRNDNYSRCALIKIKNGDGEGKPFWCFAAKVENIELSNLDSDYVHHKLMTLVEGTCNVFKQLQNEMSVWCQTKMYIRAIRDGIDKALTVKKLLDTILLISGIFTGVSFMESENS